jgi:hypothetical protein
MPYNKQLKLIYDHMFDILYCMSDELDSTELIQYKQIKKELNGRALLFDD